MTLNQAFLIKGWLLGEHPPKEVLEAIESVIEGLSQPPAVIAPMSVRVEPPLEDPTEDLATPDFRTCPPMQSILHPDDTPAPKTRREWSPEARAAAADRMRARQAAGLMTKKEPAQPGGAPALSPR
ncbi:MAG: hypothetical protein K8U57_27620 [Planctomycetes bacterium]|nr:hypothetical protein [Planctomycetota bacterium]